MIAIFSDELEHVKQLNFSLQKFESDNIEFEKRVLIYIIVYRKKYVNMLAKNQNLSNQLDSLKDTNTRLIDYVKSISKKVGTANSGNEFLDETAIGL